MKIAVAFSARSETASVFNRDFGMTGTSYALYGWRAAGIIANSAGSGKEYWDRIPSLEQWRRDRSGGGPTAGRRGHQVLLAQSAQGGERLTDDSQSATANVRQDW